MSPTSTRLSLPTRLSASESGALPCSRWPTVERLRTAARTVLLGSLISITLATRADTFVTCPTRPPFVTTTSSGAIPWFEPAAIVTLWSKVVGFVSTSAATPR